ncbi:hypothetical protein [Shewanella sp. 10N.286.54.B9]|uniref:hypothetical protein n=1 Tax=Shewanella sp. 10N.286.54.B9 TaxID=3229719 RepID=UPI0035522F5B
MSLAKHHRSSLALEALFLTVNNRIKTKLERSTDPRNTLSRKTLSSINIPSTNTIFKNAMNLLVDLVPTTESISSFLLFLFDRQPIGVIKQRNV